MKMNTGSNRPEGWLLAGLAILLACASGCGGSSSPGNSGGTSTLSGQVVQGPVSDATVQAFSVDTSDGSDGAVLGSTVTDANGNFTLKLDSAHKGPIRLSSSGGSFASEQNGAEIDSPSPLSVLLAGGSHKIAGISINPLSDFVNSRTVGLIAQGGTTFPSALHAATSEIENLYGLTHDPGELAPDYTFAAIGTDASALGLVLGALINEDQLLCPASPGGLVTALSADIADGNFDGASFGDPISYCGGNLPAIAGSAAFADALGGNQGLQIATLAFAFGGPGNILTASGITASDLVSSTELINQAVAASLPQSGGSFMPASSTPVMNLERDDATATLLPGGKVLIAGGFDEAEEVSLGSTELYDPINNCFAGVPNTPCAGQAAPSMTSDRDNSTATLLRNGTVLIAGGMSSNLIDLLSTDIYDPANNCFAGQAGTPCAGQIAPSMMIGRDAATATLLPDGMVLIAGGFANGADTASTELYDSANGCFAGAPGTPCANESTATMNDARDGATATLLYNGKVLIAGGEDFLNTVSLSSTELYDYVNNCFAGESGTECASQTSPAMTAARFGATATLLSNGKVLIAGGFDLANLDFPTKADLYDPQNNCFAGQAGTPCTNQHVPAINQGRLGAKAVILPNGKVLIAGGTNLSGSLAGTELYDPVKNCFAGQSATPCSGQSAPTMNEARAYETATLLLSGKVLFAGGTGVDSLSLASADLYTP